MLQADPPRFFAAAAEAMRRILIDHGCGHGSAAAAKQGAIVHRGVLPTSPPTNRRRGSMHRARIKSDPAAR